LAVSCVDDAARRLARSDAIAKSEWLRQIPMPLRVEGRDESRDDPEAMTTKPRATVADVTKVDVGHCRFES
jgi:hypothetical protein